MPVSYEFVKHLGMFVAGIGILSVAVPTYTYTSMYVFSELERRFPINKK